MAAPLRVRPATAADVPLLLGFIRGLAEYERLTERLRAREENLRAHLFGPRPYCEALIGEDGAGPAGYALFFHGYSTFETRPTTWLEDLFVQPDRRRQGLGRALIQRVAALALSRGCNRLEWSVLDWNEPAIRFYRSLGARLLDDWTVCRVEDDALGILSRGPAGRSS
jgi:GNAT superfamily N-acetyltransferase